MNTSTLADLLQRVLKHRDQRDWAQFHSPKELAVSLAVEAGEVLALMQWKTGPDLEKYLATRHDDLRDELADCLHSLLLLANHLNVDLGEALAAKLEKDALKYPADKFRGRAEKYSDI